MIKKITLLIFLIFLLNGCFLTYKSNIKQEEKDTCILYFIDKREVKTLLECDNLKLITDFFWYVASVKKSREKENFKRETIKRFNYAKKNYTKNNKNPMLSPMARYYILLGQPNRKENYIYAQKKGKITINWYYQDPKEAKEQKICFEKKRRDKAYKVNKKKSSKELIKKVKYNFINYKKNKGEINANIKKNKKGILVELKDLPYKKNISLEITLLIIDKKYKVYRKDEIKEIKLNDNEIKPQKINFYIKSINDIKEVKTFYFFMKNSTNNKSILIKKKRKTLK